MNHQTRAIMSPRDGGITLTRSARPTQSLPGHSNVVPYLGLSLFRVGDYSTPLKKELHGKLRVWQSPNLSRIAFEVAGDVVKGEAGSSALKPKNTKPELWTLT